MIAVPQKTGLCASCVEESADLRLGTGDNGRLVWLCSDCRTPVGLLGKYRDYDARQRGAFGFSATVGAGNFRRGPKVAT